MKKKEETSAAKKPMKSKRLRVYQRAPMSGQVILHDEDHLFIAPLNNISAGGFFVDRLTDLKEGLVVRVVIKSPRLENPIQARGTIVRIQREDSCGTAVEFTSISSRAREAIQNCVFESKMETILKVA